MKQDNLHSSNGDNQWQGPAKGCSADNDNTIVCIIDKMQWGLLQAHRGWRESKHQYQLYKARNPLRYRNQNQKNKWWLTQANDCYTPMGLSNSCFFFMFNKWSLRKMLWCFMFDVKLCKCTVKRNSDSTSLSSMTWYKTRFNVFFPQVFNT